MLGSEPRLCDCHPEENNKCVTAHKAPWKELFISLLRATISQACNAEAVGVTVLILKCKMIPLELHFAEVLSKF